MSFKSDISKTAALDLTTNTTSMLDISSLTKRLDGTCTDNEMDDGKLSSDFGTVKDSVKDVGLDYMKVNEGSRDSGFIEMNSNSNGKVLTANPLSNMNDNRQQMPDGPVIKKIKQINMEETPLHLTGLSLSGSGVQLFVKIDDHMDKAMKQKSNTTKVTKPAKTRKTTTRNKKSKDIPEAVGREYSRVENETANFQQRFPSEDERNQPRDLSVRRTKVNNVKDDQKDQQSKWYYGIKTMERNVEKKFGVVDKQSLPNDTSNARQDKIVAAHRQQKYYPYECNQNFQATSSELQRNIISGPVWNVENGRIDVIQSQDNIPTTSRRQTDHNNCDGPVDFTRDPFPSGFKSKDIPLKRRHNTSPRGWHRQGSTSPQFSKRLAKYRRRRRTSSDLSSDNDDDDDDNDDGNISDEIGKEEERNNNKRKNKQRKKSAAPRTAINSVSEEDLTQKNPRRRESDLSNGQQSSIGPQFETSLLRPETMDAETLIKFTEYTQALRKDLKRKYKDLIKLLRNFEETVEQRNNNQTDETIETVSRDGRCRVM